MGLEFHGFFKNKVFNLYHFTLIINRTLSEGIFMFELSTSHVFISYSRKDSEAMQRIVSFLRGRGIKAWVDNERLVPGTPIWEEEIEKAIKGAFAILVVLSPDAKGSEWVRREITLADQFRKRIFPVLVAGDEDDSIPLRLITRQFVNLRKNEAAGLTSLHNALSEYLSELNAQLEKSIGAKAEVERDSNKDVSTLGTDGATLHSSRQALVTLGWTIAGAIGGVVYNVSVEEIGGAISGAIGGAIGGLITAIAFRTENPRLSRNSIFWIALTWAIGLAVGWQIGDTLTEMIGMAIGFLIGAMLSMAIILSIGYISFNEKRFAWIVLAWAIGGAIGWFIAKKLLIDTMSIDYATSWAIGTAIGWTIGGFVMGWQLLKKVSHA